MDEIQNKQVVVTYSDSSTCWFTMAEAAIARIPLRNITWLHASRMRLIDELHIAFCPFSQQMFPRAVPGSPSPLALHLFLLNCDDPDVYKASVKKLIQDWLAVVSTKKNQETLIVYVSPPDIASKKSVNPFGFGSVFDRVKSDFSKTNIFQLKSTNTKENTVWNEFFAKIRELILSSFDAKLSLYEEDTRRLDAQRLLPGWNYCQFFILKDGAACTYEYLHIIDDALLQYDELEAAFFQNLQEQGAPWFQSFGGIEPGDDSHNILDLTRKPYHDMILQNTITIFDFRVYLFARQISLLLQLPNGIVEACLRAKKFVGSFSRTLNEYSAGLAPYFCESWIYSACSSIVARCDELAIKTDNANLALYEGVKADLLYFARIQLDILGAASGLFIASVHKLSSLIQGGNISDTGGPDSQQQESPIGISDKAIKCFEISQRKRTAIIMKGDIASLYFARKRYEKASDLWSQMNLNLGENGWHKMDNAILEKLVVCYQELNNFGALLDCSLRLLVNGDEHIEEQEKYVNFVNSSVEKVEQNSTGVIESTLLGKNNNEIICKTENSKLKPGANILRLHCEKISVGGIYMVEWIRLRFGNVLFEYDIPKNTSKQNSFRIEEQIPAMILSAEVLPSENDLAYPARKISRILRVEIRKPHVPVESASVKAVPLANASIPILSETTIRVEIKNSDSGKIEREELIDVKDMQFSLPKFGQNDIVSFFLPMLVVSETTVNVDIKFVIQFISSDGKESIHSKNLLVRVHPELKISH
ncbi:hypothetical protein HK100_011288, partial [Physocladia obscura]